ncbi:hypothetical protein LPJ59_000043 [Coemansia sp. RSA 2399]|nr:hypothetical protein LPJ59_000043 [Coemansia sp. RSA 2399]KAJ1908541.1 hypothetical protein LPJ81_000042 [Coemansia sp. IMI 209127]
MHWRVATTWALFLCAPFGILFAKASPDNNEQPHESASCGPSSRYVVAYYPTWKRQSLMNIDWAKITHLNVAYGIPTDGGEFTFDGEWFLPQLVRDAHKEKTKISVSIGGWTGSNRLSTIMHDAHKRASLIRAIGAFVEKYELDGVDIDWEYVGREGSKCNKYSAAEDSGNLLRFLRTLRASFHARFSSQDEKLISLAVPMQPFDGADGPMKDVSAFAEYVDYVSLLAFDVNGAWSNTTGPNAPLDFEKNRGAQHSLSRAVDQWLDAKWPADKMVAGVSFHGRSLTTRSVVTAKEGAEMYVAFDKDVPQGDEEDALWYDVCENVNAMSGVWQYKHLRDQGVLKTTNTTGEEWIRMWDSRTSTPWLYNPQMRRFISYDDPASIAKKVDFARTKNLKGMMAWSLHADYNNELLGELHKLGPLCRGSKSDTDHPAQSSSESSSSSSSMTTTWSQPQPFASLPTPAPSSTTTAAASAETTTSNPTTSSSSSSISTTVEPTPEQASPTPSAESSSISTVELLSSSSTGKAILFDSQGVPYMVIDGQSTSVPSDLAEKIMHAAEHTAPSAETDTSPSLNASAVGDASVPKELPLSIPVIDSSDLPKLKATPTRKGLSGLPLPPAPTNLFDTAAPKSLPTNLFDTAAPKSLPTSVAAAAKTTPSLATGFAATFFLTLDTNTPENGSSQSTTVIPFSQMMASASQAAHTDALSKSATLELASDPLATTASTTSTSSAKPLF